MAKRTLAIEATGLSKRLANVQAVDGIDREIQASRARILAARILMAIASVSALVAALGGLPTVFDAGPSSLMAETWRFYGLLVFAALFALLSHRPSGYRWLWEIVIANKLLLAITATAFAAGVIGPGDVDGATAVAVADGALTVVIVIAYVLCRGWRAA